MEEIWGLINLKYDDSTSSQSERVELEFIL